MTRTELIESILKIADKMDKCIEEDFHTLYEQIEILIDEYTENIKQ